MAAGRAVPRYVFFTMLAVMMTVTLTDTASRHAWKPVLIGMTGAAIVVVWAAWRARHAK